MRADTEFGYTLLCEQTLPKQLVADLVEAEEVGFEYSVISDHAGFTHIAFCQSGPDHQKDFRTGRRPTSSPPCVNASATRGPCRFMSRRAARPGGH